MPFRVSWPQGRAALLLKWSIPLLMLGVVWFAVIRVLWNDWMHDPQYSYGALVPLLVLGLLLKRWVDRPPSRVTTPTGSWLAALIAVLSAGFLALLIPLVEANPEWRPLVGAASVAAIVITLDLIFIIGGRPWLRHFTFPILFFLIAIPWPRNFEQWVMGHLMAWNTSITLEVLHWLGYDAVSRGNLILLPCGLLGIEEACSGIRSLQSGLMVALFFGELLRLGGARRLMLVILSVMAALLGNIMRSAFLATMASSRGIAEIASWHDSAGFAVLLVTIMLVVMGAFLLRKVNAQGEDPLPGFLPRGVIISRPRSIVMAASLFLVAISLVATEVWFRLHEGNEEPRSWFLKTREGYPGVAPVVIPPATLRMLFNPEGFSEKWITSAGVQGQAFYFRWPAGRTSVQAVAMHRPEVCLGNIGMRMKQALYPVNATVNGFMIPFRAWLFEQNGKPVYVFHAVVEDGGAGRKPEAIPDTMTGRLQRVLGGRRNQGERVVEVAFWNVPDEISARSELMRYLREVVTDGTSQPAPSGGTGFQPLH